MATDSVQSTYSRLRRQAADAIADRDAVGEVRVQVGSATCEDAAGAQTVFAEFRKHVEASGREDILLRRTGCTGRCSSEPIVSVFVQGEIPVKYANVDTDLVHRIFTEHILGGRPVSDAILDARPQAVVGQEILFCSAKRCGAMLRNDFVERARAKLEEAGLTADQVRISEANCFGLCKDGEGEGMHMLVLPSKTIYRLDREDDLDEVIHRHISHGQVVEHLRVREYPIGQKFFETYGDVAFFNRQSRIALRNSGTIDPEVLDEYVHLGGFEALAEILTKDDPQAVIDQITASNLRGRGGGGYPTGLKWANAARQEAPTKYVICNADEGDPGAFMDRSMLEGDPFSVLEGMLIAGFAIGAERGFLYIRAEYPKAIGRIENAIEQCRRANLLGKNVLGSSFSFDLEVRLGAGAFVCGEETALIHSIEGQRGQPRIRPPYPAERGLWDCPTTINNVETFANVPVVTHYGAKWFAQVGTEKSGGAKVFALAGKVCNTGLVEVPMGTSLREIVFDIGGGVPNGKKLKAIQTGGPAGGCIPPEFLDTPVDFDSLTALGSIMGSGGMIIMDEDDCMVDIAKFFLTFSQDESCGKCTPCREGTTRMLEIIERITDGRGEMEDLDRLERLANVVRKASLCGLGRAAPNPVLSTLRYFRDEYEAHVRDKRCPAAKCRALVHYEISPTKCVGCTACARACPVSCIDGTPKQPHIIDQSRCIKCGRCFAVCKFEAVNRR